MGELIPPPLVKREDGAPGGHPEAENVPPPGTQTLTNGDDTAAAGRLGMSPLKLSAANEGRPAASPNKVPASEGRLTASPNKVPTSDGRPTASPHKVPAFEGCPSAFPHKGPTSSPYKASPCKRRSVTSPRKDLASSPVAGGAVRRPMLILHRLNGRNLQRKSDLLEMGLSETCALRIRKELARARRNYRRRYMRRMASFMNKQQRAAGGQAAAEKGVGDGAATGES